MTRIKDPKQVAAIIWHILLSLITSYKVRFMSDEHRNELLLLLQAHTVMVVLSGEENGSLILLRSVMRFVRPRS